MSEPAKKKATYEDLYDIPGNMTGEIIDGELVLSPRPSPEHMFISSFVGGRLLTHYYGRGGPGEWIILDETEIKLEEDTFVPDIAGWKTERFFKPEGQNWVSVIPDWVCEILSPSSIRHDRITKMGIYAKHRVPYFWLIDPLSKTLEVFNLQPGGWMLIGNYVEDDKVRAEPFPEFEIELGKLWVGFQSKPPEQ